MYIITWSQINVTFCVYLQHWMKTEFQFKFEFKHWIYNTEFKFEIIIVQ